MKYRSTAIAIVCCLISTISACSTVSEHHIASQFPSPTGSLIVSTYDTKSAMNDGKLTNQRMEMTIYDRNPKNAHSRLIRQDQVAEWRVDNLPSGEYYLKVSGCIDDTGKMDNSKSQVHRFSVSEGEVTVVNLVLTDYAKSTAAAGGAAIGTATVLTFGFCIALVLALIAAI